MRRRRTNLFALAALAAAAALPAQTRTLIPPGEPVAAIVTPHLHAYVPAAGAQRFAPLVARAEQIYAHMQHDAAFVPDSELNLLLDDWWDAHNGFSFVVPLPVARVVAAPADPAMRGFAGDDQVEHRLIRELATQIANNRNTGIRGVLETVFGRLVPNDIASLLLWYLSTPSAPTQPHHWQAGVEAWAEIAYGDANSAWRGYGLDPLTQMVWRLDAGAELTPATEEWNANWHEWPFGERASIYGAAYTRFLDGRFKRASMWSFVRDNAERWAFMSDGGSDAITSTSHDKLLELARMELLEEQRAVIAHLRTTRLTQLVRRTRFDTLLGAPAWLPGGVLAFAAQPAQGRARLHRLTRDNEMTATDQPTLSLAGVRALPDYGDTTGVVYHEVNWHGTSRLVVDGVQVGEHVLQPDAGPLVGDARTIVAIELTGAGTQRLAKFVLRGDVLGAGTPLPTQGTPWSPALRRGDGHAGELAWVETDASGSRLVLGSLDDPGARTVLWSVRGRILHPAWSHDGTQLFCCADHTGIANAYRVTFEDGGVRTSAVTNTIGGVVACVPSPDGKQLALIDHDQRGPFVATMPSDPATDVAELPTIKLVWPAPVEPDLNAADPAALHTTPLPPLPHGAANALVIEPYSGLRDMRPLYWGVTTFAVPEGGDGVYGLMADPLFTNVVQAGAGVGPAESQAVGFFQYDHLAEPIELGVRAARSERTFAETVQLGSALLDYTETVTGGEFRVGRGVLALERQFRAYASIGAESHDEVNSSAQRYAGGTFQKPPFRGVDGYIEVTLGYDDSTFYPTSYAREDGFTVLLKYRYSGLFGDLVRNRALADVGYTWSILPRAGHQVLVRTQAGWSDGADTLQGNFTIGGGVVTALPRGYIDEAVDTGRHLVAGSLAYRFPLWRPFTGGTPPPVRARQLIAEIFGDTAQVSDEKLGAGSDWFTSVGAELFAQTEFANGVNPGIGVAVQLDGKRETRFYFSLGVTL